MSESKGRASRLRVSAIAVVLAGVALGFLMGAAFPAATTKVPVGLTNITSYTVSTDSGDGSFNWLFTILVAGPCLISGAILYGSSEIVAGLRRSARTRSSEGETQKVVPSA